MNEFSLMPFTFFISVTMAYNGKHCIYLLSQIMIFRWHVERRLKAEQLTIGIPCTFPKSSIYEKLKKDGNL